MKKGSKLWNEMREHLELFLENAEPGDHIIAKKKRNGKWNIKSSSRDHVIEGEDEDFRVAFCIENK